MYSLLDGAMTTDTIASRAKELDQPAIALTDHGTLGGIIKFWDSCKKHEVMPIIGIEAYLAPGSRLYKEPIEGIPPAFHLTLLAQNTTGLHNLYRLSSLAYTEGFYHKPRVDAELLRQYNDGLICLSGCIKGKIQWILLQYATSGDNDFLQLAVDELNTMTDIFGDRFYIEVQRIIEEQEEVVKLQRRLCNKFNVKAVATCDAHYAKAGDMDFHDQIICLSTGKTIKDDNRMGPFDNIYIKSEQEMRSLWHDWPEALETSMEITERCKQLSTEDPFDNKEHVFPVFTDKKEEDYKIFEEKAWEGLKERGLASSEEHKERLKYELQTIKEMGFPSYFLVVSDYCNWAKKSNIAVGPGRGSAAGSLVSYCLGITEIDPLKYGLLFQRFLNKGRRSLPDIDCDFCMNRRSEVIDYLARRYGADKVAQISTFAFFKPRGACRDFARAQGEPYSLGEEASKLIPPNIRGREPTWEEAIKFSPQLLSNRFNNIISAARKSEGIIKQRGIHAGGVVISPVPLMEVAPVCYGRNKEIVTQWDMKDLERIGLVKMDMLGITALTVISSTVELITQITGKIFDITQIPIDDEKTFDLICQGETSGLFQLDTGGGIRELCMRLKPRSISELSAISAMYRPGPLDSGVTDEYVDRVNQKKPVTYLIPELEPILKDTYGLLIYQEQAMRIATDLAGYTLEEADNLRKAIGKKKPEDMAKEEKRLISGMEKKGIPSSKARTIWEQIKVFADYGFNLSHSVAYSYITYQTAFLKTHFPVEFYCALLSLHVDNRDKLAEYLSNCRRYDIQVLPPDINQSGSGFTIADGVIRFGLSAIKDVGDKVCKKILKVRKNKPFTDLVNFYDRTRSAGITKRTIEALAKAGAFDSLEIPRSAVLDVLDKLLLRTRDMERYKKKMETYNKRLTRYLEREDFRNEQRKRGERLKPSLKKPQKPLPPQPVEIPDVQELNIEELMRLEKEMLGFYVTSHPLYAYEMEILRETTAHCGSLQDHVNGEHVVIIGVLAAVKRFITRKGQQMAVLTLEDLHGTAEAVVFPRVYSTIYNSIVEDAVVSVTARVEGEQGMSKRLIVSDVRKLKPKASKYTKRQEMKRTVTGAKIYLNESSLQKAQLVEKVTDSYKGMIQTQVFLQIGDNSFILTKTPSLSERGLLLLKHNGIRVKEMFSREED